MLWKKNTLSKPAGIKNCNPWNLAGARGNASWWGCNRLAPTQPVEKEPVVWLSSHHQLAEPPPLAHKPWVVHAGARLIEQQHLVFQHAGLSLQHLGAFDRLAQLSLSHTHTHLGLVAAFHQHVLSVPAGCAPPHCLIYSSYQIHIAKRVRRATFHLHAAALQIRHATLTRKMAAAMHANVCAWARATPRVWVCVRDSGTERWRKVSPGRETVR